MFLSAMRCLAYLRVARWTKDESTCRQVCGCASRATASTSSSRHTASAWQRIWLRSLSLSLSLSLSRYVCLCLCLCLCKPSTYAYKHLHLPRPGLFICACSCACACACICACACACVRHLTLFALNALNCRSESVLKQHTACRSTN